MEGFDCQQEGVEFEVEGFDDLFTVLQIYDPLQSFTVLIPVVVQYVLMRKTTLGLEQDKEPSLPSLGETVSVTNWSYTGTSLFLPGQSQYTNKQWSSSYPHAAHGPSALTSLNLLLP